MKRHFFFLFLLFLGFYAFTQTAIMPSGAGTQNDPYVISTLENLYWVSKETSSRNSFENKYFQQNADINAAKTRGWFAGKGWIPIGFFDSTNPFRDIKFMGNYDGNGHIIDSLYAFRPNESHFGLFGYIQNSTIENLGLTNLDFTGSRHVAGLVGTMVYSHINMCFSKGRINCDELSGGLIGFILAYPLIIGGGSSGHDHKESSVQYSYSHVNITGNNSVGGFVALNNTNSTIKQCYSAGSHSGALKYSGGFAYTNVGQIENCFWDIEKSVILLSSGGTGKSSEDMKDFKTYINSLWAIKGFSKETIWNIDKDKNDGYPFLNWQFPEAPPHPEIETQFLPIVRTYPVTDVTNNSANLHAEILGWGNPTAYEYGFCWNNSGMPTIADNTINQRNIVYLGKYSMHLPEISPSTKYYVRAYATNSYGTHYGDQVEFTTYNIGPIKPHGNGLGRDPYLISNLENLLWLAEETSRGKTFQNKIFSQTSDIDASPTKDWFDGKGWKPITRHGDNYLSFAGASYYGNGYVIDGLHINRPDEDKIGLFGEVYSLNIYNLGMTNANIIGRDWVGAFAGHISGGFHSIRKSYSTGHITGQGYVGGLIGHASYAIIDNCFSESAVTGIYCVGGLVGSIVITNVSNSYSKSSISAESSSGGFIGFVNSSLVENCYSIGKINIKPDGHQLSGFINGHFLSTILNCFWDIETSESLISHGGGTGLKTEEMKDPLTYFNAGWSMKIGGLSDQWNMSETKNNGFPYLIWQHPDEPDMEIIDNYRPFVKTIGVSDYTNSSANINAVLLLPGNPAVNEYGVCWNTEGNTGIIEKRAIIENQAFAKTYTMALDDLSPNTTYFVKAYALNNTDTVYGEQISFTTQGAALLVTSDSWDFVSKGYIDFGDVVRAYQYKVDVFNVHSKYLNQHITITSDNEIFEFSTSPDSGFVPTLVLQTDENELIVKNDLHSKQVDLIVNRFSEKTEDIAVMQFYDKKDAIIRFEEIEINNLCKDNNFLQVGDIIVLNLFHDVKYEARISRITRNLNGTVSIIANIEDIELGSLVMSSTGKRSLGQVWIPEKNKIFHIISDYQSGSHYIIEMCASDYHTREIISHQPHEYIEKTNHTFDKNSNTKYYFPGQTLSDTAIVDIMIRYTPQAREWGEKNGGGMDNLVAQAISNAQIVFDNSLIGVQFNLFGALLWNHDETIINNYMASGEELRDFFGADLMTDLMVTHPMGYQGSAAVPKSKFGNSNAFGSTVIVSHATTTTFSHELGHNFGGGHNKEQARFTGPNVFNDWPENIWSAGMWIGGYFTLMSYPPPGGGSVIPLFSNPNVTFNAEPMGHPLDGDNTRTVRELKHAISSYRPTANIHSSKVYIRFRPNVETEVSAMVKVESAGAETQYFQVKGVGRPESALSDNINFSEEISYTNRLKNELRVYPNPAGSYIWIEFTNQSNNSVLLETYDAYGQILFRQWVLGHGNHKIQIDTNHFRSGIYFIRVFGDQPYPIKKVIINN